MQTTRRVEVGACPICLSKTQAKTYYQVEDFEYHTYKAVNYVACAECGVLRQEPLPPSELIGSFYPEDYRNYRPVKRDLLAFLKDMQADGFARQIGACISFDRMKKILDLGFGNGQLLLALKRSGYENLYGADFSCRNASSLEAKRIKLAFCDAEKQFPFSEKFDCIIMNNVIEHFLDPVEVIDRCREHLLPGGVLIMVTPNAEAFELGIFNRFWAGFHAPRHTFLFSKKSLILLAQKLSFHSVSFSDFNDPGQWAISFQSFLQSFPFSRCRLDFGLSWYAVPVSILTLPLLLLQNLMGKSTAMLCLMQKSESD